MRAAQGRRGKPRFQGALPPQDPVQERPHEPAEPCEDGAKAHRASLRRSAAEDGTRRSTRRSGASVDAGDPVRAGERDARHRGRLDRQRDEILGLEVVDVRLAARAGERLRLEREHAQVVRDPAAAEHGVEARRELVVLRRDAGRIAAGLPVVVEAGRAAELAVLVVVARGCCRPSRSAPRCRSRPRPRRARAPWRRRRRCGSRPRRRAAPAGACRAPAARRPRAARPAASGCRRAR